jgi:hypothetical protein
MLKQIFKAGCLKREHLLTFFVNNVKKGFVFLILRLSLAKTQVVSDVVSVEGVKLDVVVDSDYLRIVGSPHSSLCEMATLIVEKPVRISVPGDSFHQNSK